MSEMNVVLFGSGKPIECVCMNYDSVVNHLRNFDADFGFSRCMVKNADKNVVRFAKSHFCESGRYTVQETGDGLLVSYLA